MVPRRESTAEVRIPFAAGPGFMYPASMTDVVRKLMNAVPFIPFVVKTSDGKQYRVKHPDYVAISPKGEYLTVYADEEAGTFLRSFHIVAVEPQVRRTRSR